MVVNVHGGEITEAEKNLYVDRAEKLHAGTQTLDIYVDGDYVDIDYHIMPFDRIRRITGYLVGKLDRWNDSKLAELEDRVTHNTESW